ncbi:GNAT family N-acetyltransferase [uncultured Eudoraea sp.]|uniref:GNAT family N-acetyltransferase n=1 Tax=uncultured Eudoraea sp. TaxID=1035614 RepID=UPI0026226D79|nr:GNAT family N-acetyltransferase [uncultured Eudoraea sp.]
MQSIEIRLANTTDAEYITLLGRVTFPQTFGYYFRDKNDLLAYYNRTFSVAKIRSGFENPNNLFWLALVDDLPVGYAKLNSPTRFSSSENICQMQKIYVLQDFLSMKIGLELQNSLLNTAREKGFDKIWLSVPKSNERAINFYGRSGFEKIGDHDFQIGKEHFKFVAMLKGLK